MSNKLLNFNEIVEAFIEIGKAQGVGIVKDMTEETKASLVGYASICQYGQNSYFTVQPEVFMSEAYDLLSRSDFPWIAAARKKLAEVGSRRFSSTSKKDAMFLDALVLYMLRCQAVESVIEQGLTEPVNYFTKKDDLTAAPTVGPFTRVSSTFFGKELSIWEVEFPEDHDVVVVYTNEGFLRMIFRRQQGAIINY